MVGILSFTVEGADKVQKGLAALLESMKDLTPFWRDVFAPKYFALVQDLFATGGRSRGSGGRFKGGAWAGLSPQYRIWKTAHYPGRPILVRDGALRESVRWSGTALGPGGIFDPHPRHVVVGTAVAYAAYHQYGTMRMPARPFLPTPDPNVFAPLLAQWLMKHQGA